MEEREIDPVELPEDPEKISKETVEGIGRMVAEEIESQIKTNLKQEKLSKLKPFFLEAARSGKPVCTRDGRKARIICFDRQHENNIVALIAEKEGEFICTYLSDGSFYKSSIHKNDLMMATEKKEMWINIYNGTIGPVPGDCLYDTEEDAKDAVKGNEDYVTTIKVSWEE